MAPLSRESPEGAEQKRQCSAPSGLIYCGRHTVPQGDALGCNLVGLQPKTLKNRDNSFWLIEIGLIFVGVFFDYQKVP